MSKQLITNVYSLVISHTIGSSWHFMCHVASYMSQNSLNDTNKWITHTSEQK